MYGSSSDDDPVLFSRLTVHDIYIYCFISIIDSGICKVGITKLTGKAFFFNIPASESSFLVNKGF